MSLISLRTLYLKASYNIAVKVKHMMVMHNISALIIKETKRLSVIKMSSFGN